MLVQDLINKLTIYAAQSPENGSAEVMLASGETCFEVAGANDAKGMFGEGHFLILIPNMQGKRFNARNVNLQ